jgi:hypothetical protein
MQTKSWRIIKSLYPDAMNRGDEGTQEVMLYALLFVVKLSL